ncbi:MAG: sugar transferase [Candidatus Omnitrophica bacterium]|nr:sugar transferase [Candidatus Omnitrophota bacterium]
MIKQRNRVLRTANVLLDSVIVVAAMLLACFIRTRLTPYVHYPFSVTVNDYFRMFALIIPLMNLLLYMNGLYPTNRLRPIKNVVWIIFKADLGVVAVFVLMLYAFRIFALGRMAIAIFAFLNFGMFLVKEIVIRKALKTARKKGLGLCNVMIIGDRELIPEIVKCIMDNPYLGLNLAGIYVLESEKAYILNSDEKEKGFWGIKVFDPQRDIRLILLENQIDNVVIAVGKEKLSETEELLLKCEEFGAEIWLYADFFELMFARKEIDTLGGIPLLIFSTTPQYSWATVFKRMLDIIGSLVLFILTVPLILLASAMIKLTSPGPVLFRQKRVGLHGRKFIFYKFRSMVTDAEQRRQEISAHNIMKGPVFKIKADPRITPVGRFLRSTSIDELPQLWNVLKGDMSLVGPRPPLPREVSDYRGWQRRRLSMRPGLTCLWQVQGRSKITDFDEWARLDLKYIDNWSLWLDSVILFKTIFVVLFRVGAE